MTNKATVTASGRMSLPADIRKRYGLSKGGEVIVEDTGDAIVIRTLDQLVHRAQAMARQIVDQRPASVDDFLADRRKDASGE
ncbi:MAG: AbrB/MazE/SpoVT family DNA-binding domain-containing protein [Bosea sp. (in: a-proteobacteria)]